jgi:hypothetical protein
VRRTVTHLSTLRRSPRALVGLALVGAWAVFFARALLTSEVPFDRDVLAGSLPWRQFLAEWASRGTLPQWYPHETLGAPFVGSVVPATFHPATWLLLWLPPAKAIKVTVLLAFLAAECGAYRAARLVGASRAGAVIAGYALAFGGYAVSMSNNLPYLVPLSTMPWVFVAAWRVARRGRARDAALLAFLWALVLLGGDLQGFCECAGLVLVPLLILGATLRRVALLGAAGAVACCLVAIELLPALDASRETLRAVWHNPDWVATGWALHPLRLPELAIGHFIPYQSRLWLGEHLLSGRPGLWSYSLFAGGVTLWLGALGLARRTRTTWVLGAATLLATWLALGHFGGLLQLVWRLVPALGGFRYPEKYLGLAWVTGALLAGLGFDALRSRGALWAGALAVCLGLLVLRVPVLAWVLQLKGLALSPNHPVYSETNAAWSLGLCVTGACLIGASLIVEFRPARAVWALPALVFVELYAGNHASYRQAPLQAVDAASPWADAIRATAPSAGPPDRVFPYAGGEAYAYAQTEEARALLVHATMQPDDPGRAGLDAFGDMLPSEPARSLMLFAGQDALDPRVWSGAFNLCYRVDDDWHVPAEGVTVAAQLDWLHLSLFRVPCRDRAFVAGALPVLDESAARERMRAGLPPDTVVWEGGPALAPASGSVRWLRAEPNVIALAVTAPSPAALVVSDAWAPGWSATIDGVDAPLWRANVAVRGVSVPAGTHQVTMTYRAPGLRLGALVSLLACILAGGLALSGRRRVSMRL